MSLELLRTNVSAHEIIRLDIKKSAKMSKTSCFNIVLVYPDGVQIDEEKAE
jgi:hypothetical protein